MYSPRLYHTYPLSCFNFTDKINMQGIFAESYCLLKNKDYSQFAHKHGVGVLDCGVGASPDLNSPKSHLDLNPSWGIYYLNLADSLNPECLVVPDVLGDGDATQRNFNAYIKLLSRQNSSPRWSLMYVIQGRTLDEAKLQLHFAISNKEINVIGFPRKVHYYNNNSSDSEKHFGISRMNFLDSVSLTLQSSDKQIHLLGMNSMTELKYAAVHGYGMDTRLAVMSVLNNFDFTKEDRPNGLDVDLLAPLLCEETHKVFKNMDILNEAYNGWLRH